MHPPGSLSSSAAIPGSPNSVRAIIISSVLKFGFWVSNISKTDLDGLSPESSYLKVLSVLLGIRNRVAKSL